MNVVFSQARLPCHPVSIARLTLKQPSFFLCLVQLIFCYGSSSIESKRHLLCPVGATSVVSLWLYNYKVETNGEKKVSALFHNIANNRDWTGIGNDQSGVSENKNECRDLPSGIKLIRGIIDERLSIMLTRRDIRRFGLAGCCSRRSLANCSSTWLWM